MPPDQPPTPKPTWSDRNHADADSATLYVTFAAASQYHEAIRSGGVSISGIEVARRELTELLLDARPTEAGAWRYRRRSTGLDITARIVREGRLDVVTSISVRGINVGGGKR